MGTVPRGLSPLEWVDGVVERTWDSGGGVCGEYHSIDVFSEQEPTESSFVTRSWFVDFRNLYIS